MKKTFCITALLFLILSLAHSGICESLYVDNRETDKVYPERLNLRAQPSKSGAILGLYYTGAEVENLGAENDEYTKVRIGGVTGYMASEYLITWDEAVSRYGEDGGFGQYRAAQIDLTGMWMTQIPLLKDADAQGEQLAMIESGKDVGLIAVLDEWAYIAAEIDKGTMYGYVPLDCLTDVNDLKVSIIAGSRADTRTILYDAPNDRAKEIMILKNGTACFNLFGRREGEWRRVRVGGVSGWIRYTQADNLFALGTQQRSVVPYYPLQMQTKSEALLLKEMDNEAAGFITLGKDMKVEVLAECGDYAYVRTYEGGAGAYDCGDFGYVPLAKLALSQTDASVGVAQADNGDVPVIVLAMPDANAEVIGVLCGGAQVRIADYTQTDYVQILLGELKGYIPKDEIRLLTSDGDQLSDRIPQRAAAYHQTLMKNAPKDKTRDGIEIPAGEKVCMLGRFGDWAFVQYAEHVGLNLSDDAADSTGFVKLEDLNAPVSAIYLTSFSNTDKVNLRDQAGTDGAIIGRVRTGERLRVAEYGKSWSVVVTPAGKRGYIMTKYLDFE